MNQSFVIQNNTNRVYLTQVFEDWSQAAIASKTLSEGSRKIYLSMWRKFSAALLEAEGRSLDSVEQLSRLTIGAMTTAVVKASKASATSYPKRMAQLVSRVITHHVGKKHPASDLAEGFSDNRAQSPVYLSHQNRQAFVSNGDTANNANLFDMDETLNWKRLRNKAIAAVSLYAGLRLQEIVSLRIRHISFDPEGYIFNVPGSKHRTVPIAKEGNQIVGEWIASLRVLLDNLNDAAFNDAHLFISTLSGKPMTKITAHRATREVLNQQTATAARNTFALRQITGGVSNELVLGWMGYKTNFTVEKHFMAIKNKQVPSVIDAADGTARPNGA